MFKSKKGNSLPGFTLTLVRHGETEANVSGIVQGQGVDSSLNRCGIRQSEKIGEFLSSEVFDIVYSSDLKRAKQTCEIILKQNTTFGKQCDERHQPLTEITFDRKLRERCFGVMEGRYYHEMDNVAFPSDKSEEDDLPQGAESIKDLEARALSHFQDLCEQVHHKLTASDSKTTSRNLNVLVVSHGGLLASPGTVFAEEFACLYPRGVNPAQISVNTSRSKFTVLFNKSYCSCGKSSNLRVDSGSINMKCDVLNDYSHLNNSW